MYTGRVKVSSLRELCPGDHISLQHLFFNHHAIVLDVLDKELIIIGFTTPRSYLNLLSGGSCGSSLSKSSNLTTNQLGDIMELNVLNECSGIVVKVCPSENFLKQTVHKYKYEKSYDVEKVLENAYKVKNGEISWGEFSVFENNCEHFASWCKCGEKVSKQVLTVKADVCKKLSSSFGTSKKSSKLKA